METLKKLKEQGWHLTEEGLKKIMETQMPGADIQKIIAAAMHLDFREIAGGALPAKREDSVPGRIVLQVLKIRNISAPRAHEDSKMYPRMLQVDFTDGQLLIQGLELEPIPTLNLNVAPGSKVYFRCERLLLLHGFAILKAADIQLLGGRVEHIAEKWELARTMLKYAQGDRRVSGSSGPPPWIAFGKQLEIKDPIDARNFKSFQAAADKDKNGSKDNEEFNAMRMEAIAEAAKAGTKKVFGGGNQQIPDHNVKKILEKGYSYEDAKQALRSTNNNLERALYNLKRRDDFKGIDDRLRGHVEPAPPNGRWQRGGSVKEFIGKRGATNVKEEEEGAAASTAKPVGNVSLFDFLTKKLPSNAEAPTKTEATAPVPATAKSTLNSRFDKAKSEGTKQQHHDLAAPSTSSRPKFENNISSSFTANRSSGEVRSGGGSGRHEREHYNANDRHSNNRYSNVSGRGGSGRFAGRGSNHSHRGSQEDGGNRGYSQRREGAGPERGGERNSNSNSSNNNNNRGNRLWHERSNAANAATPSQSGTERNQKTVAGGSNENRRSQESQNKGHEKSRYNHKDQYSNNYSGGNNRRHDNSSRQQSSYNNNNNNNTSINNNTVPVTPNANNVKQNNSDDSGSMNKLVELTSKLKIDKSSDSGRNQQKQNQRQQPQPQQYSSDADMIPEMVGQQYYHPQLNRPMLGIPATGNYSLPLANGFNYDPSKIIGFQNKETNEFAMTLLKSQGMAGAAAVPVTSSIQEQKPTPLTATTNHMPSTLPTPPAPFAEPALALPNIQPVTPPQATTSGACGKLQSWHWKIGDLCLAKYWDDGKYYDAEITGISDKTCVVFFRGYGNHEEVLHTDCLPVTDENHRSINHCNADEKPPSPKQAIPSSAAAVNLRPGSSTQTRGVPNRFRGERQVYVPPPKRDN